MTRNASLPFALRRILSSLAAIAAISVIFGAKALESERAQLAPLAVAMPVSVNPAPHTP